MQFRFSADPRPFSGFVFAVLALATTFGQGCRQGTESVDSGTEGPPSTADPPAIFVDRAAASGLDFVHFNGMSGELYYSEMMGSGVALFDADNDGDLDVYLVQGSLLNPDKELADATFPPAPEMLPLRDRLYRNDLDVGADGKPRLHFTDVTEASGLRATGYGMGVATGDFDNDGWTDLYVTNAGPNQLWRNNGPGADGAVTFSDVTAGSGTDDKGWSLSAAWLDADGDGWLDLYVTDYVDFVVDTHQPCRMLSGIPDYCGPQAFSPLPDRFLKNLGGRGDGARFEAFADIPAAAGMGVVAGDFDGDGRLDIYVANDAMANQLWRRQGDGTWADEALLRGSAFNGEGLPEAGMGVVAGDYDGDGDEDLLATHLALETHTLYRNDGGSFADVTVASGLGASSWQVTGFGSAWIDVDNDGWLDLLTVDGAVILVPELVAAGEPHPLGMPNQLFRNLGPDTGGVVSFADATASAGEAFQKLTVSRGLAVGDVDNDGDADAVVTNNAGAVQLLINQIGQDRHWLGLRLVDAAGRDAVGATAEVVRGGGSRPGRPRLWRRVTSGGGYLSAHDPRLLFGLGDDPEIEAVSVRWPGGEAERFDAAVDRYTTLVQGSGSGEDR